jgi:DMSO/TMAO reductase YedYZ molybdopterin-dependent catalytic subunit
MVRPAGSKLKPRGPFRPGAFRSSLHDDRTAALLGIALGVTFSVCFATGLLSHLIQHPPGWFEWPPRPAGLYRITQGLHVVTGVASIPLLLLKLWTVYPHLWTWPPVRDLFHAIERLSLVPLVAGSIFLLFTGVANIDLWYPWPFFFPAAHYSAAWITIGALLVHVAAKWAQTMAAISRREPEPTAGPGLTRRGFVRTAWGTAALMALLTAGQTVGPLRRFALLAPRLPDVGPGGWPVNKTAAGAHVTEAARASDYRLVVEGAVARPLSLTVDQLHAMSRREAELPITCVEGWSATVAWRGIPVRELLDAAGAAHDASVRLESLQPSGLYRFSELTPDQANDADALLATHARGRILALDHGYPVRLIAPNRPGVLQTKWVAKVVVL